MDLKDLYRHIILQHYKNPQNKGLVNDANYLTIHLNNPSCGDDITVQVLVKDGYIKDLRQDGSGCSICCSSASVATQTLKNIKIEEAIQVIEQFYELIKGNSYNKTILKGDALVYQSVHQFPARIKCATLAWKAIEKGLKEQ